MDIAAGFGIVLRKEASQRLIRISSDLDITALAAAGRLYASTAAGIADTVDGEYFFLAVDGADSFPLYLNVSEVAVDQGIALVAKATLDAFMEAPPFAGGGAGAFLVKASGRDGDAEYRELSDFARQQSVVKDLSDSGDWQIVGSNIANFSWAIDGDEIEFTSTSSGQHAWASFGEPITLGSVYYTKGRFTTVGSGSFGVGIGFTTTAPTLGGSDANVNAADYGIVYRENGGLVAYDETGGVSEAGVSFAPGGSGTPFGEDDVVEIYYTPLTSTTANIKVFVNGLPASEKTVTHPAADLYFAAGVNLRQTGQVARLSSAVIKLWSLDFPLRIVVDADAADGGDGTPDLPFNNFDDVNALIAGDKRRRHLAIYGRGVFEGQCLYADQNQWRRIEVIGSIGREFVIDASIPFAPTWTQIGATDRWYATHPGYDDNNDGYGGLIEVTSGITDSFGLNGDFTIDDEVIQNRVAANTDPASALFVNGAYGSFSVHYLATYVPAGSVIVRCADGGDPNTKDWRWIRKAGAINFAPNDDTALMAPFVRIVNVTAKRAFLYNIRCERSILDFINVNAPGGLGFGFELNHSCGRIFACTADGTMLDNCHWSDGSTAMEVPLDCEVDKCTFRGGGNRPYGVGDNLSNHNPEKHRVIVKFTKLIGAGKHCISTTGGLEAFHCLLQDGKEAGFSQSAVTGLSGMTASLTNCEIVGNYDGVIHNLAALTGISSTVTVRLCHFHDNQRADVRGFSSGAGSSDHTILDRNWVSGPVPPDTLNRISMADANSTYEFVDADIFSEATRT